MRVRPHHGMCLAFFEGKGYSGGFTAHMAQVRDRLLREDPEVCLCPDRSVLEQCGLKPGQRIRWSRFSRLVDEHILSSGSRETICGDCQWNELCAAHRK